MGGSNCNFRYLIMLTLMVRRMRLNVVDKWILLGQLIYQGLPPILQLPQVQLQIQGI